MPICTKTPIALTKLTNAIYELLAPCQFIRHAEIGTSHPRNPFHALTIRYGAKLVLINAAFYANEWVTALILMRFLEKRIRDFDFCKAPRWAEKITPPCGQRG